MAKLAARILRHAFGDALDDASLEALSQAAVQEVYTAGDVFVRQGEIGDALYVIVEGLVEVSQKLDDGQEIVLAILEPGQYVGELALLDQEPRMATCRAVTPLTLLSFNQQVFTGLTHDNPAVARLLLGHVIKNMRGQDQLVIRELRTTNEALRRAYIDLQRAQAELVEKERLEHELALAAEAQRSLLPGTLPDFPPLRFAAYLRPARQVGGDFYDVIVLDEEHVGLLLADVADKGMHAALIMAVARTLFRTEARRSLSPSQVALSVHEGLLELERTQETFLTAFYGVLHRPSGKLTYVRAAHEKPLLLHRERPITVLEGGDRFLGMLPHLQLTEYDIFLEEGDRLLIFSDGVPDATNERLEAFGYERLMQSAASCSAVSAEALVCDIVEKVDRWSGSTEPFDDLTLLAVEVSGERPFFEEKG